MTLPGPPSPGAGERIPRDSVHDLYRPLLPARGVLAGGGGFLSASWRVVVDLDGALLSAARAKAPGAPVYGDLEAQGERALSGSELEPVQALWRELVRGSAPPEPQRVMTADSMGVLIAVDGGSAYELVPPGPITVGTPAELSSLLWRLAWPAD
jgi:hypothetical protein